MVWIALGTFLVGFLVGLVCAAIFEVRAERDRRDRERLRLLALRTRPFAIDYDHDGRRIDPDQIREQAWPEDAA